MIDAAANQLRSYIDRILRLKEEQKALTGDIRDIYAEAKSMGFDKTALGKVVTIVEKRGADPLAFEEQEALVDTYLHAYDSAASRVHAREAAE